MCVYVFNNIAKEEAMNLIESGRPQGRKKRWKGKKKVWTKKRI